MYSISEFAKKVGVTSATLRRWQVEGKLTPIVLSSGHRRYNDDHFMQIKGLTKSTKKRVIYARESTKQQKNSLTNQVEALKAFCMSSGKEVNIVIEDFGSGLNYKRKGLQQLISLISTDQVSEVIVHYPDRLMRFGLDMFLQFCTLHGVRVIFVDETENSAKSQQQEFAEDLISIVHYFSMRLYGSRTYKEKKK
jgi:predicted site-specific integrase-resolvase